ncbi:class II aldolase/adducin family protein [Niabella terrae]
MKRIYDRVLTTTSGGNLSIRDEEDNIWITPAGVDKGLLKPSDIVCVTKSGEVLGDHKPSSEYPFHLAIYQKRPDIRAVVHAHPPGIVAFSIARKVPDTSVLPQFRAFCGEIGYASYAMPGTEELGKNIANEFRAGVHIVIMENHGTVVGAEDLSEAYQKFEMLEVTAKSLLYGARTSAPVSLNDKQISGHLAQFHNELPEESEWVTPSSLNREKRTDIDKIVKRACRQGLMLGSYGSVSARWKDNDFIITPDKMSKWDLTLDDMVHIREGKRQKGKMPDKTVLLHQAIYEQHPDINAVIFTQPTYLTSFAITGTPLNVRTIPETWIYLQDVRMAEFGAQFLGTEGLASLVSAGSPLVILKNECVVVTGNKLLQAFDYLEVAEFSAKSLVLSSSLGELVPISDEEVEQLGKVMSRWKNYDWKM